MVKPNFTTMITDDDEWGSDHLPTMILINETLHEEGQAQRYNLKRADWEKYKETCKLEMNKNQPTYPDNPTFEWLTEAIQSLAANSIPDKKSTKRKIKLPYWNERCKEAIRNKRKAKRRI